MKTPSLAITLLISIFRAGSTSAAEIPSAQFEEIVETILTEMTETQYQHKTEINEETGVWSLESGNAIAPASSATCS